MSLTHGKKEIGQIWLDQWYENPIVIMSIDGHIIRARKYKERDDILQVYEDIDSDFSIYVGDV